MVVEETLPSGMRLVTEAIGHVRSVTVGAWVTRGSRHETDAESGVAHFVEHMLFKGTTSRSAREIAQTIDSIGGQLDAFTAKEYAGYYIKVLDEHLPVAIDLLSDMLLRPALAPGDVLKEQQVILEEIKMVEDAPDDLVHELFAQQFWSKHPLGRPILGTKDTVEALTQDGLRRYFAETYSAPNLIVAAVGNIEHERVRDLVMKAFGKLNSTNGTVTEDPPNVVPTTLIRNKDLEQSHVCLGTGSYRQDHDDMSDAVSALNFGLSLTDTQWHVEDYDFEAPGQNKEGERKTTVAPAASKGWEQFRYPGGSVKTDTLKRVALAAVDAADSGYETVSGRGGCASFTPAVLWPSVWTWRLLSPVGRFWNRATDRSRGE